MSDKYSLDDILSEYNTKGKAENSKKIDIDSFLDDYDNKKAKTVAVSKDKTIETLDDDTPKVTLHNTDIFQKIKEEDERESQLENVKKAEDNSDFSDKYKNLPLKATEISEKSKNSEKEYIPEPKKGKSFSEKFEEENKYNDSKKTATATLEKPVETPVIEEKPKEQIDPFDKFAGLSSGSENRGTVSTIDDILKEYDAISGGDEKKNSVKRSLTEFFTKLIPPGEKSQNDELLEGMNRIKKERISRTQHLGMVERKSISDIELNLDDKILPDTAQIEIDMKDSEIDKLNQLNERRSKKIKDFVLVGDEEETSPDNSEETETKKEIDGYESFEDAPSILSDIKQLKNTLIIRLFILSICALFSLFISLSNDFDFLPKIVMLNKREETEIYLFVNLIIGIIAVFLSFNWVKNAFSNLMAFKSNCDTLPAISIISSLILTMCMYVEAPLVNSGFVQLYITSSIIMLVLNTVGKCLIVSRTERSFSFISGATEKYAVFNVEDKAKAENFTRGALRDFPRLSAMKKTEFITDFMNTTYENDVTDKICRIYTPIILAASALIGLVSAILNWRMFGFSAILIGFSVFIGTANLAGMFSMMLVVNLPLERSSQKNAERNGFILGNEAIEEFAETNSILVDASELFPAGSVKLVNIKVYSDTRIDEAIVEAASLTNHSDSILKGMFYEIIAGKTELLNPVESYIFEDSLGLCGWINNKRVLLGNRELMINHSIDGIPTEKKEKEYAKGKRSAVYLSISGELSALFVVELNASTEIKNSLKKLQKKSIYTVIHTVDSLVSINHLSELFDISPEFFKLLPFRNHEDFDKEVSYTPKHSSHLACSGRFSGFTSLLLSCKDLHTTITVGIIIQSISALLAIIISIMMVIFGSYQEFNVSSIIIYNFAFTAILLLFQLFRKN